MRQLKVVLAVLLVIDVLAASWVAVNQTWIDYTSVGLTAGAGLGDGFATTHAHPELHLGWWEFRPSLLTLGIVAVVAILAAVAVALLPHPALAISAGVVGAIVAACFGVYGHPSFDTVRFGPYALTPGAGTGMYAGIIAVLSALALGVVLRSGAVRYQLESQTLPLEPWSPPAPAPVFLPV